MNRIKLAKDLEVSRIIHGHLRLADWHLSNQELLKLTEQSIDIGITTFDHADIYGGYSCEKLFGDALINLAEVYRYYIRYFTYLCVWKKWIFAPYQAMRDIAFVSDQFP